MREEYKVDCVVIYIFLAFIIKEISGPEWMYWFCWIMSGLSLISASLKIGNYIEEKE